MSNALIIPERNNVDNVLSKLENREILQATKSPGKKLKFQVLWKTTDETTPEVFKAIIRSNEQEQQLSKQMIPGVCFHSRKVICRHKVKKSERNISVGTTCNSVFVLTDNISKRGKRLRS